MSAVPAVSLEGPRRVLVVLFVAVGMWYLHWRLGTFNPEAPLFSRLVYAAELFGFTTAALHLFMCWRLSVRRAAPPRVERSVDVFVPTYNESVELVRKTLLAALAIDGAHTTWLLDDGRRPEMARLARELGCRYLARGDNRHAKAGNLNHALAHSSGDLIAIFDADHAPRRHFLRQTLGYFDDEHVAFVQTPQDFYNLDSYQHRGRARTLWTEQSLFFRVIQRGKDSCNAAFFCGSCAVVRRSALEQIGGFATGTVTEDLHTSLRLHARGWRSVYHAEPLAFGLAPETLEPFIAQRVRWGQGAMHVWRSEGILTHKGLTLAQRLNYLASVLTYFDGWQKLVFYVAPVVVLTTGTMPLITTTPAFLLHFVPYYLLTFWVFEEVGRGYSRSVYSEQYKMARFAAFAWATLAWISPRLTFRVTPKGRRGGGVAPLTAPQWLVLAFNVGAIPVGIAIYASAAALRLDGLIANVVWAAVNGALALAVLAFTRANQRQQRARYRFAVPLPAEIEFAGGAATFGTVDDVSDGGLGFYGALPATVAVGDRVAGRLWLPDGALPFAGEVRARLAAGDDDAPRAVGIAFDAGTEGRRRLEAFLYGSDLQWRVNGLSECTHTPLSRWLPRLVPGPRPHPLAGVRWNSAQLRTALDAAPQPALVAAPGGRDDWLASYAALPEGRPLPLDVFRRGDAPRRCVRLERIEVDDDAGGLLHLYRAHAAAMPAAGGAAHAAQAAIERARRRGTPSTFAVDPTTL